MFKILLNFWFFGFVVLVLKQMSIKLEIFPWLIISGTNPSSQV